MRLANRVGGILVAPRTTLANLAATPAGQGIRDLAILLVIRFFAGELAALIAAAVHGSLISPAELVGGVMVRLFAPLPELGAIVAAGLVARVVRGRSPAGKISPAELAGYAWIPFFAVQLVAGIGFAAASLGGMSVPSWLRLAALGAGIVWSLAVLVLVLRVSPSETPARHAPTGVALLVAAGLLAGVNLLVLHSKWAKVMRVPPATGSIAPDIDLPLANGGRFHLAAERAPVLMTFWATWCTYCKEELPVIATFAAEHPGVRVVTINVDEPDDRQAVDEFVRSSHLALPVALDDGRAKAAYLVESLPRLVLLDPDHRIKKPPLGLQLKKELEAAYP
jgi:thiol-disulfide isomerase/thioredoxin